MMMKNRNGTITVKNSIELYEAIIETVVRRISVENKIPRLPIARSVTNKNNKDLTNSTGEIPPNKNTKLYTGSPAIINNSKKNTEENNFPSMILNELWDVVNSIGNVCLSRSPLIVPAVKPGVMNRTNPNCINVRNANRITLSEGLK